MKGFGQVVPVGDAGKHGYQLEFPQGHAKNEPQEYVPRGGTDKITNSSMFRSVACQTGWDGFLNLGWVFCHDVVKHSLETKKPVVLTGQDLSKIVNPLDSVHRQDTFPQKTSILLRKSRCV